MTLHLGYLEKYCDVYATLTVLPGQEAECDGSSSVGFCFYSPLTWPHCEHVPFTVRGLVLWVE